MSVQIATCSILKRGHLMLISGSMFDFLAVILLGHVTELVICHSCS